MSAPAAIQDVEAAKARLKATWMAGDYDRFSRYMEHDARDFYERLDVPRGAHLLDVACGSGQLALLAARDGVAVTGVDIASNLIARARERARAEGLRARFEEADAEDLPFDDGAFDVVTSLIGAMFAPRPDRVAHELLRVCAPGGTIAMANWTPQGFVGRMLSTMSRFIAPSGAPSPLSWGDEAVVRDRFGAGVSGLRLTRRDYTFSYPFEPAEVVEFFRLYYGPTSRAFAALDEDGRRDLRRTLEALWSSENLGCDGVTVVKAEYLEVVATRA